MDFNLRKISIKYPLISFFILAYIFTWLLWAPSIASSRGLISKLPQILSVFGSFGPALAAIVVSLLVDGRKGLISLFGQLKKWKVKSKWYMIALLPILLNLILIFVYVLLSGNKPEFTFKAIVMFIPTFLFWLLVGGPLGEEIGWRGFALPILLEGRNALSSSLYLALIWVGWHLPRYLDPQMSIGGGIAIIIFAIQAIIFSILFTWLYINAKGSLLIVILFHAAINSLGYIFPMFFPNIAQKELGVYFNLVNIIWLLIFLVWAIAIVVIYGPKKLLRQE